MAKGEKEIRARIPNEQGTWVLAPLETSPCTLACPTRINARGYVSLISDGKFAEALALIRERNPFPGVCGRVCPRPCEAACTRGKYDEPIAICALKRFVFDLEMKRGIDPTAPAEVRRADKVAVIGAGPAGLSAARELALLGYPVTVFEAKDTPGGMMNLIPEFRLPRAVVRREARAILDIGIALETGVRFGEDLTWNQLRRRGYKALLLGTGAWNERWKWGSPRVSGVYHAIDFLRNAALEIEDTKVVVAGDGMMALDCARTAVRLGAKSVLFVLGTSRERAPVHRGDLAEAEKEGVKVLALSRPSRLVTKGKKLTGVRLVGLREGTADATGRREIFEITGSEIAGACDVFVDAHARGSDAKGFGSGLGLTMTALGTVGIDAETCATGAPGVFAAGDLVTGPRSVVEAIASGQKAAYGIHQYLSGETAASPLDLTVDEGIARREFSFETVPGSPAPREKMPLEAPKTRRVDFREVEKGYPAQAARREAQRCLRCGPCGECAVCVDVCEKKDFLLRVNGELIMNVHAGREFWSRSPEGVVLELGDEHLDTAAVRTVAAVDAGLCVGCGRCQDICGYRAVQVETLPGGRFIARVDELACKGCGTCAGVCPTGAMDQLNFTAENIRKTLDTLAQSRAKVLFVCHWARPERLELPRDVLVIETLCAGRVAPQLILEAVLRGSPKVLVVGCGEDCHYGFGSAAGSRTVRDAKGLVRLFGYSPAIVAEIAATPEEFALAVNKWAWKSK